MSYQEAYQEPYTKYPNRYNDIIKPTLTDTQKAVCDVVIRLSYGWRKSTARISLPTFVTKTGKSRRAIITAKQQLISMGLLVVIEPARGTRAAMYALNLYYNTPSKSLHHQGKQSDETEIQSKPLSVEREQPSIQSITPNVVPNDAIHTPEECTSDDTNTLAHDIDAQLPESGMNDCQIEEQLCVQSVIPNVIPNDAIHTPEERTSDDTNTLAHDIDAQLPEPGANDCQVTDTTMPITQHDDTEVTPPTSTTNINAVEPNTMDAASFTSNSPGDNTASEPITAEVCELARGADNAPLANDTIYSTSLGLKKTYRGATPDITNIAGNESATTTRRQEVATVRSKFNSTFPDTLDNDDWPFFGWAVSAYGMEVCMDKLSLIGEYRKTGKVLNPKGLFRHSLIKDYWPSKFTKAKIHGDKAARLAIERSRRKSEEWDRKVANFDYESAQSGLDNLMKEMGWN